MSKMTFRRFRAPFGLVLGGLLSATLLLPAAQPQAQAQSTDEGKEALVGYNIATVSYTELLKSHKSFDKLLAVDNRIALLQQEKQRIEGEARTEIITKGGFEMDKAVADAKKTLEKEQDAVQAELRALSNRLSGQLEGEMRSLQAAYQADLERRIKQLMKDAGQPEAPAPKPLEGNIEGQVQDYMQNLAMVRERNLAAKRLELEKQAGDAITAKRAEVEAQVGAYEADLAAQYQSERLNLQLTTQNASDEEAKKAAYARLEEIANEIANLKAAKRTQLESGFGAVRAEQTSAMESEMAAYQQKLDLEVRQKVDDKRRELGMAPRQAPQQQPAGKPPEIQAEIDAVEAQMKGELAAKQASLRARMEEETAVARKRLETKQKEVEEKLMELQKQVELKVKEAMANLPDEVKEKIETKQAEIDKLSKEREALYDAITASLNKKVEEIAKGMEDKNVEMVVGLTEYEYSTYPDLTDRAMAGVATLQDVSASLPSPTGTPQ